MLLPKMDNAHPTLAESANFEECIIFLPVLAMVFDRSMLKIERFLGQCFTSRDQ